MVSHLLEKDSIVKREAKKKQWNFYYLFIFSASITCEYIYFCYLIFVSLPLFFLSFFFSSDKTIAESRGHTVELECPIDFESCGSLHSVKWFKGGDRVAVVSGDGEIANVEGSYSGR